MHNRDISTPKLIIDLLEVVSADEAEWERFLNHLKAAKQLNEMIVTDNLNALVGGYQYYESNFQQRSEHLFYILFKMLKVESIRFTRSVFTKIPELTRIAYAKHLLIISNHAPIKVDTQTVLDAYASDEQGLLIRQVPSGTFMKEDWLSILNSQTTTRLLSATFVLNDVPIALIGQVPENQNWSMTSGIIYSHQTTCRFAGKRDMGTDFYYLRNIGGHRRALDEKALTADGKIDFEKMYQKNDLIRHHFFGAKVKKSISELRDKVIEQRQRIQSSEDTYTTTHGKQKTNEEKEDVQKYGILINNEALINPDLIHVQGVYVNTYSGQGLAEAFELQIYLNKQGISVGLFTYNPSRKPALMAVTRDSLLADEWIAEKLGSYTLRQFVLAYGFLDNFDMSSSRIRFWSNTIAQSYFEFFTCLGIPCELNDRFIMISLPPTKVITMYHDLLISMDTITHLCRQLGWLSIQNYIIPGKDVIRIIGSKANDANINSFIKRFFSAYASSSSSQPIDDDKHEYIINVDFEKAKNILVTASDIDDYYVHITDDASVEDKAKALAIESALKTISVPALIPKATLPFIEANAEGVFIDFMFLFNYYDPHLAHGVHRIFCSRYYREVSLVLDQLSIKIPEEIDKLYLSTTFNIKNSNRIFPAAPATSQKQKPKLTEAEIKEIEAKFNSLLRQLNIHDDFKLVVKYPADGGCYARLVFPKDMDKDTAGECHYRIVATLADIGDFEHAWEDRPAHIMLASLDGFVRTVDLHLNRSSSTTHGRKSTLFYARPVDNSPPATTTAKLEL